MKTNCYHSFIAYYSIDFIKTKLLKRTNPSDVIIGIVPIVDHDEIEDGSSEGQYRWITYFNIFDSCCNM